MGLIDVLIGLLLLTIGLLATAGLHARMSLHARTAQHRASASQLAHDLVERMRANPAGVGAGDYDAAYAASAAFIDAAPSSGVASDCAVADQCSAVEIAARDLAQWHAAAARLLPAAGLGVQRNATVPASFDIHVIWTSGDLPSAASPDEGLREACPASVGAGDDAYCLHLRATP